MPRNYGGGRQKPIPKGKKKPYQQVLDTVFFGKIITLDSYSGARTLVRHKCLDHNEEFFAYPIDLYKFKCIYCTRCIYLRQLDSFISKLVETNINYIEGYVDFKTPCTFSCKKHGALFNAMPIQLLQRKHAIRSSKRCPECRIEDAQPAHNRYSEKEYQRRLKKKHPHINLLSTFVGMTKNAKFKCTIHNTKWIRRAKDVITSSTGGGCRFCASKARAISRNRYKTKPFILGKRKVMVQGYEDRALTMLLAKGIPSKNLAVHSEGKIPTLKYMHLGKEFIHYPDIIQFDPQIIYEVKSWYTFGLTNKSLFERNRSKCLASRREGRQYRFLLFHSDGTFIPLPKGWTSLTHKQLVKELILSLGTKHPILAKHFKKKVAKTKLKPTKI